MGDRQESVNRERLANEISMYKHGKPLDKVSNVHEKNKIYDTAKRGTDKALNKYLRGE